MAAEKPGPDPAGHQNNYSVPYNEEYAQMESWLDEHPDFFHDYFIRKVTRKMVDKWLCTRATSQTMLQDSGDPGSPTGNNSRPGSGSATPVRKISAHEFERGGQLKPMVTTVDGTPTFLSDVAGTGTPYRLLRKNRNELRNLNERQLIFELVKDICNDLDVRSLCHKILQNVGILTNADRSSLFLVQGEKGSENRCLVSELFDVNLDSTIEEMEKREEFKIPWGTGIIGYVAEKGEAVNIPDAYEDIRFNDDIDKRTGYKTRSVLCMPIKDINGEVLGVAQVINKIGSKDGELFDANDEKVFASYLQFCGIGIRNAQLYERSQLENKRNQVLLDLARIIFEEQSTIEHVVYRIMTHTQSLLQCERCQVLLVHEPGKGTFSRMFDLEARDLQQSDAYTRTSPFEGRFPTNIGITGYVATSGQTVNIPDAYKDKRFDHSVDDECMFKTKSILCMPIKNAKGQTIGVIQLINKQNNFVFTKNDENFLEAFAIFFGMGIHNTQMYETAIKAMAKQRVTLEVLSYHATAPWEDVKKLKTSAVQSSQYYRLHDFTFNDFSLTDDETLKACIRMFLDLDLVERFHIDYEVLCRWLLSVKRNYRQVTYHNWRHAFNVAQMMFAILKAAQFWKFLGELECLGLLVACVCHDLDHRGTNNSFQIMASSPLAQLYSTSTMEHHHFDQCIMILNSQGNQILSKLTEQEYTQVIKVLEDAILSTDLAIYFRKRVNFFRLVNTRQYDWRVAEHKELLRAMLMTACDVGAITKPWEVQKTVAELVASEFFEQGDKEKRELHITPIDMMNRDKKDMLPSMQVSFIDSICLPIYEAFAIVSEPLQPLLQGVQINRAHWQDLADERNRKEGNN